MSELTEQQTIPYVRIRMTGHDAKNILKFSNGKEYVVCRRCGMFALFERAYARPCVPRNNK